MMNEPGGESVCMCSHHKMFAVLTLFFGLLFLLGNLNWLSWNIVNIGWPILVIVAGGFKFMEGKCKCC